MEKEMTPEEIAQKYETWEIELAIKIKEMMGDETIANRKEKA